MEAAYSSNAAAEAELPRLWLGFLWAFAATVGLFIAVAVTPDDRIEDGELPAWFTFLDLGGAVYWLWCVKKLHDAIDMIDGYRHPISAGRAVAMHFIPFYNIYWVFRWPAAVAEFVNWRTQHQTMRGWVAGLMMLTAVISRNVLSSIGLLFLFGALLYVSRAIRKALDAPPVPAEAMAPPGWSGPLGLSQRMPTPAVAERSSKPSNS